MQNKVSLSTGLSLMEVLVTLAILAALVIGGGVFWSWNLGNTKEKAYANAIEALILRGVNHSEVLEQPIAICFSLTDGCRAEGMLYPRIDQPFAETAQEWHLLEALPFKDGVIVRSNFSEDRLILQAGGKGVRQPGTIYICSANPKSTQAWGIVVARSGRVTSKSIQGDEVRVVCGLTY